MIEGLENSFVPLAIFNNKGGSYKKVLEKFEEPSWNNLVVHIIYVNGNNIVQRINGDYSAIKLCQSMKETLIIRNTSVPLYLDLLEQELAGAKDVTLVSKQHDGYCLWPSKFAPTWNSMDVGPQRDLVGGLSAAVRKKGLKMGLYYSLTEWNNPLHRWYTDPNENIGNYIEQHMIPQFKELVVAYKPSLIFADGEWFNSAEEFHTSELLSWYYKLVGEEAIVNN